MAQDRPHIAVLFQEVIAYVAPHAGGRYIDATLGAGGHAAGILDASAPNGQLLGLDADPAALAIAAANLTPYGDRVTLVHANFERLSEVAAVNNFLPADGIIFDLGLSSMQLSDPARGFSFQNDGPLNMRFNPDDPTTAADLVNSLDEEELADLIYEYGEEHASRRIARALVHARPIRTASQLAGIIESAVGRHGRIHPATRTFQALRIQVNREIEVLQRVLPQIPGVLALHGRVAIISFHSLEDRLVKNFVRTSEAMKVLTKHPVRPKHEETVLNPRSRSAKLRVAEKIV